MVKLHQLLALTWLTLILYWNFLLLYALTDLNYSLF